MRADHWVGWRVVSKADLRVDKLVERMAVSKVAQLVAWKVDLMDEK